MFGFGKKKRQAQSADAGTLDQVVPRIKHVNFLKAVDELAAQAGGSEDRPVTTSLIADLLVTYAFDLPHAFQMVMKHDLARLNVSQEELSQRAIQNFRDRMPAVEFITDEEEPAVLGLQTGQHLEACMLLIPEFWTEAANEVAPARLVASVPTRDLVMFTNSESASGLAVLREVIRQAGQEEERTHNLSEHLLVWVRGRWEVFPDPTAA